MNREDFNVTVKELADVHAVSANHVNKMAVEGAFPYVLVSGDKKVRRMFHKSALELRGKDIQWNRETGRWSKPVYDMREETKKKPAQVPGVNAEMLELLAGINGKLDTIIAELGVNLG